MGARGPLGTKGVTAEQVNAAITRALGPKALRLGAPATLDATGKKLWNALAPALVKLGMLTALDITQLEIYCDTYSRYLAAVKAIRKSGPTIVTSTGYEQQRPEVGIANQCARIIDTLGKSLGLSPLVRARFAVAVEDDGELDLD